MDEFLVSQVRRFNRFVSQRIGALNDHYLARSLSLGQARMLWEISMDDGRDVRWLRTRLELDSGYASRLLRSLEAAALITVAPKESDRRVHVARLTDAGKAERAALDAASDALAASFVARLSDSQRSRLVNAMAEVERLLTAGLVLVESSDPADPRARYCLAEYFSELDKRFETGFDPGKSNTADDDEQRPPNGLLLLATLHGEPVGCGAVKLSPGAPAEIKRMWVSGSARGLGLGRRLLAELEAHAAERGAAKARLETNSSLAEAISLYRSAGYVEVESFSDEKYAHHWFEKALANSS